MDKPVAFDRNHTYDPAAHPDLWEQYVRFTQGQMMELVRDYGPLDILWLDGGQVGPQNGQDIRLSDFMLEARKFTPDLLVADRTIGDPNENYITPEQSVPDHPIRVPWESCVTLSEAFSYRFDPVWKTPRQVIGLLIDVVCRGGNLALNIAPQPDGRLPAEGVRILDALGAWLRKNGEAVYGTRLADPNESASVAFTRKGDIHYALLRLPEKPSAAEPLLIPWPHPVRRLTLLCPETALSFRRTGEGLLTRLPPSLAEDDLLFPVLRME